ncbi:ABC transporter permease [Streptomyces griseiscabiei]|uniref:FtsX-like permease family protein n=1 Tax=Streptomyces griseiscabiei TaxID=2993540 RepID=A0ABU4L382_9ACTN|nr:FtsX-like permease family protein [Streptomyces griseiscabiei]MBZ3901230.1 FtsX-like permease family protein [Streptomyces griseiscabiei]MDX2910219.1 FtsX-like permease family protein [Streptomyces griseiscabiei]
MPLSNTFLAWIRDLGLGIRFAAAGGRGGWARTALTATGVALGVALLLLAASTPNVLSARAERGNARQPSNVASGTSVPRSDSSFVWDSGDTDFRSDRVGGLLLRAEGSRAPAPPGVAGIPAPGEMVVSPALRELLDSSEGALLKERLDYRVVGTIAPSGLLDAKELRYYAGTDRISVAGGSVRAERFGYVPRHDSLDALLYVLVVTVCVVLLVPVGIFIATAVRFGGDRRDRRLAALRLIGADRRTVARIAAGEALFGSVLGVVLGAGFFLVARQAAAYVRLWDVGAHPGDIVPRPALAVLVAVAVPLASVVVTLSAMRSVSVEPLGVVRSARPRRRRLGWRLVPPVLGLAILLLSERVTSKSQEIGTIPVAAGVTLVLVGLAGLLPWLVEAAVAGLRGGPVPWQLAVRRLQLSSGAASRAVSGIMVATAGAIVLQLMFGAMQQSFMNPSGGGSGGAGTGAARTPDVTLVSANGVAATTARLEEGLRRTPGVTAAFAYTEAYATAAARAVTSLTVGDCAQLRKMARLPSCRDGDTFVAHNPGDTVGSRRVDEAARPGRAVTLDDHGSGAARTVRWTLPQDSPVVPTVPDPLGERHDGILATPGALPDGPLPGAFTWAGVFTDPRVTDGADEIRNTAAEVDPTLTVRERQNRQRDKDYESVQTGPLVGGTLMLVLVAASMLVSQIEQLRERRNLLSVLVAFGTRRSTLAWSVLWQTAVPVVLSTLLASAGGLALGQVMLGMLGKETGDRWVFLPYAGVGGVLVLLVTLLSLPALWRMMRPEGLRTE